ncbi:MAG: DUF4270 family protein [Lepagella sp.]
MKHNILTAVFALMLLMLTACEDEVSTIGQSIYEGTVAIKVDSIVGKIQAASFKADDIDSRNATKLLGRINVPEYGSLDCSFVTEMLCASKMNIPDSITVNDLDSMRLVLSVPRGSLTGDSLAPQQLKVYHLGKRLPSVPGASFDPSEYYHPDSLMGSRSYSLSNISKGDSAMKNEAYIRIPVKLNSMKLAHELFTKYRNNDPVFEWPSTFNDYFHGIYVEQNFGNGCIANIAGADFFTYWHRTESRSVMQPDSTYAPQDVVVRDSICLLGAQPEVVSSNIISYKISDKIEQLVAEGSEVITTPGGYMMSLKYPVLDLIDAYRDQGMALSVVSSLSMEIPAKAISNDYGLSVAPYLLMVKKKDYESFFKENKVPDGVNSFYAEYDTESGSYKFSSMRSYFVEKYQAYKDGTYVDEEESEFYLVPVSITKETVESYSSTTTYVTRCQPYLEKPTMTLLDTDKSVICFTYAVQKVK